MNFKQAHIFLEVVATNNFTKAAENLYLTQSAVSHAVKELEEECQTPLFHHLHRSVRLTTTGEILAARLGPVMQDFTALNQQLPHLEAESPLNIAACITYGETRLAGRLQDFRQAASAFTEASFSVQIYPAQQSLALLEQRKVDLAVIEGQLVRQNLRTKKIADYDIIPVATPSVAASFPDYRLSLNRLLQQPLLLRERGSAVRETFVAALQLAGYTVQPQWESVDSQTLIAACLAGFGIAFLPEPLVTAQLTAGTLVSLTVPQLKLSNDITLVCRRESYSSPLLRALWDFL